MSHLQLLSSWSRAQACMLLEELKKHPVLYDQEHPFYQFRAHKLEALRKICANLNPIKPNMTPKLIAIKIKSLKSQYVNEKKNIRKSLVNQKPGALPYKPKLWCYELMTFLDEQITYDTNLSDLQKEEYEDAESEVDNECLTNKSSAPSFEEVDIESILSHDGTQIVGNSQKRNTLHSKCLQLVECLTNEIKAVKADEGIDTGTKNEQSPSTFLGLMVESELSKVNEEIYDEAKWKIIRILEEASVKNRAAKLPRLKIISSSTSASTATSNSKFLFVNGVLKSATKTPVVTKLNLSGIDRYLQNK